MTCLVRARMRRVMPGANFPEAFPRTQGPGTEGRRGAQPAEPAGVGLQAAAHAEDGGA